MIILSAALDLVGPNVPKGIVLLADVMPSFITKLVAPYFIHHIPYRLRILIFVCLSSGGMLLIALTPSDTSVGVKLLGVVIGSLSSGGGELSFLGLTHYYGPFSLAAWGSGTGGAGLIGAGLYVMFTTWWGLTVQTSLFISAFLPLIMLLSFFVILPREPLSLAGLKKAKDYEEVPSSEEDIRPSHTEGILAPHDDDDDTLSATTAHTPKPRLQTQLHRARALFLPFMLPLLLVYIAEYTINQGVSPTLLFPIRSSPSPPSSNPPAKRGPITHYRDFYPLYSLLYQLGVFVARSSTPFYRIHNLYLPSILQCVNLGLLIAQSLFFFLPNVYFVGAIILWEGLLGGAVYVNTFAEIMEKVPRAEREFSLGATSVSDSGGIVVAGLVGLWLEPKLCEWNVKSGRPWCRMT